MMVGMDELVLASASPRRAELLTQAGIRFRVKVSPAEEPEIKPEGIPTELWPMCLAFMKGKAVQGALGKGKAGRKGPVILAADTIVVEGARILNKAGTRAQARRMLMSLRGKEHRVITGVALLQGERVRLTSGTATVKVRRFSDAWLTGYLESGLWRGKAGAYGIQDAPETPFRCTSGEFSTVVGLPIALVSRELAGFMKE